MDGWVASSGGADGVELLKSKKSVEQSIDLLAKYFPDNITDIRKALEGQVEGMPNIERFIVLGCRDTERDTTESVCVCLEKKLPAFGLKVVEIIWFGSQNKGLGWGSKLFRGLINAARGCEVDALLSTSTNAALPFWLTRPNIRIAETILRAAKRSALEFPATLGFKVAPAPASATMERLYTEPIVRNRKGRIVGDFEGKPYYYCVENSNHVWYILNPKLHVKTKMKKSSVVVKTQQEMPVLHKESAVHVGSLSSSSSSLVDS